MASYDLKNLLEKIADAIRVKDKTVNKINAQDFPSRIRAIPQGVSIKNTNTDLSGKLKMNSGQIDTKLTTMNGKTIFMLTNKTDIIYRIINNSNYVTNVGIDSYNENQGMTILSFSLWKNAIFDSIQIRNQGAILPDTEYTYQIVPNEDAGTDTVNIEINLTKGNIYVSISVTYTEESVPPTKLEHCDIIDYIETSSNRNTYVNTGITPRTTLKATFIGHLTSTASRQTFFGTSDGSDQNGNARFSMWHYNSGTTNIYFYTGPAQSYPFTNAYDVTKKRIFILDKYQLYIDGNLVGSSTSTNSTSEYPIYLFAWDGKGTANSFGQIRCYGFSIEEDGQKLIDLIPVYDRENSRYGLYDYVTNEILYGIGGELLGGYDE